jgi:FkbM family methyltransferase
MRTIIVVFRLVAPSDILGLLGYFVARTVYKVLGVRLFKGISLTFRNISLYLRPDFPSGVHFIKELIADDVYRNFHTLPRADESILLDVGANIGLLSLDRCLSNARLRTCCFEPHPETCSLLRLNVELNQLSDRITVYNYAVSDHTGNIAITADSKNNMAKTVESDEPAKSSTIQVACWTLDALCSVHHIKPTFLKVDVEGHEVSVLTGAKSILNDISEVIVECHSEQLALACKQLLTDHGFTISYASGLLSGQRAS